MLFYRSFLLLLFLCSFSFFASNALFSEKTSPQNTPIAISLKGHLGKEALSSAKQPLNQLALKSSKELVLEINSTSGDLNGVLEFAKEIYEIKAETQTHVIIFINDNAVGPAAILPFLADELYISPFISWGDIPLGGENAISTNILRNRVSSLIPVEHKHAPLLQLMAAAMSDHSLQLIDNNGWKIRLDEKDFSHPLISPKGETLVVNQHQLKELDLVAGVMPIEAFQQQFHLILQSESDKTIKEATSVTIPSDSTLSNRLKEHIKFNPTDSNQIGHILINNRQSGIDQSTWLYVKAALDHYKKTRPLFVILELDTPGGEVFAAQKISDALKELDTQYNIPVVAYINNWAISAGAMLAYSCRFIAVVKDASMGAAEPVIAGEQGEMKTASEKINSALRTDFANRASFFDRNPDIAEGMVDKDVILVMRYGKIIKLNNENQMRTTGPDADVLIKAKGKLLTLSSDQLMKDEVADILVPPTKTAVILDAELAAGKWPAEKSPLFHQPFFKEIPHGMIDSYQMDWKTKFFVFLATPMISSLLLMGMMIGLYTEFTTPGFGFPGTVGVTCLFLIILSHYSLEIANFLELILLLAGISLILVDLFLLPTFGLLGFIGFVFFLMGLFGMMLPEIGSVTVDLGSHSINAAGEALFHRLAWLCGTFIAGVVVILLMGRYFSPSSFLLKRLVSEGEQEASLGYIAGENPNQLPQPGTKGEVTSTLRPAGKVFIQGVIYDAMSRGGFIEKGEAVIVENLEGSVIIVGTQPLNEKEVK